MTYARNYKHYSRENSPRVYSGRVNNQNLLLDKDFSIDQKGAVDNSRGYNLNQSDLSSHLGNICKGTGGYPPKFEQDISFSTISNIPASIYDDTLLSRNVVTETSCIADTFDIDLKPRETDNNKKQELISTFNRKPSVPVTPEKKAKIVESAAGILGSSKNSANKAMGSNQIPPTNSKIDECALAIPQEEIGNDLRERLASRSTQNHFSASLLRPSLGSQSHMSLKTANLANNQKLIQSPPLTSRTLTNSVVNTSFQNSMQNENIHPEDPYKLECMNRVGAGSSSRNLNSLQSNHDHTFAAEILSPNTRKVVSIGAVNSPNLNGIPKNDSELLKSPYQQPPNKLKKLRAGASRQSSQNSSIIRETSDERGFIPTANRSAGTANLGLPPTQIQRFSQSPQGPFTSNSCSAKKLSEKMSFKNSVKNLSGSIQKSNERASVNLIQANTPRSNEVTPFCLGQNQPKAASEIYYAEKPSKNENGGRNCTLDSSYESLETLGEPSSRRLLNTVSSNLPCKEENASSQRLPDLEQARISHLQEKNTIPIVPLNKPAKSLKINMAEIQANNSLIGKSFSIALKDLINLN